MISSEHFGDLMRTLLHINKFLIQKKDDGFLEEHPGKDDDPDGGGGTDHVGVSHGHVLQTVEVDNEVACSEHRS